MEHQSVLLASVVKYLAPRLGETYLDLTAGMGGHARVILAQTKNYQESVLVDQDKMAIANLQDLAAKEVELINSDFASAMTSLINDKRKFDLILLDLGVSSPQLDTAERGFSFRKEAWLDMRMNQQQKLTASHVVNKYPKRQLIKIFVDYGEESAKTATRIADAIIKARPIQTTIQLADLIENNIHRKSYKIHPATRIFQAIRIEVNQELEQLKQALTQLPQILQAGGRVAIISFHSLEDRLVKTYFKQQSQSGLQSQFDTITSKPILGSTEDAFNPRARSAILRVAIKKQKQKGGYNAKTNTSTKQITS